MVDEGSPADALVSQLVFRIGGILFIVLVFKGICSFAQ